MKYRTKPVIVDAVQWFKPGDHPNVQPYESPGVRGFGCIETPEGLTLVAPGDWIITQGNGDHRPCSPDIFSNTYEKVEE